MGATKNGRRLPSDLRGDFFKIQFIEFTLNPIGKRVMCMSDFEIISIVLLFLGILIPLIIKYIDKKK